MTQAERKEVSRLKFLGSMYYSEDIGPYLPAQNVFASLIEGARTFRKGTSVKSGLFWEESRAVLEYDGPRDPGKLWNDGASPFVDRRMATVNRARIPVIRVIFPGWSAVISLDFDDTIIDLAALRECARVAGRVGVGDYRQFYGSYRATLTEE